MEFDVDAAMSVLLPWDLTLKIGGKKFKTRPPTIAQLGALDMLRADKSAGSEFKAIQIFREMFEQPDEAMAMINASSLTICVRAVMKYAADYAAKNSRAVAAAIAVTAADSIPGRAGNSSQPTSSPAPAAAIPERS